MAVTSRVQAVFGANSAGLVAGTRRASTAIESLSRKLTELSRTTRLLAVIEGSRLFAGVTSAALRASQAIVGFSKSVIGDLNSAVQAATALGEETSKSLVTFGNAAENVTSFAAAAQKIGLAETQALSAANNFGVLFRAFELGKEEASAMAVRLTSLAADLASFNNTSVDQALAALGAGLRGEAEPLRRFGVLMTDNTLRAEAFAQGLTKDVKTALDPATKGLAAYNLILRQTGIAQGDVARTSDSLANIQRRVQSQLANIQTNVGGAFVQLWADLATSASEALGLFEPVLKEVISGVKEAADGIGQAVKSLLPDLRDWVTSLDGKNIGEQWKNAMKEGALLFASGIDYVISGVSRVFANWRSIAEAAGAVASGMAFVGSLLKGVFDVGAGYFRVLNSFSSAVLSGITKVASFLTSIFSPETSRQLDEMSKSFWASSEEYSKLAADNFKLAGENIFGGADGKADALTGTMRQQLQDIFNEIEKRQGDIAKKTVAGGIEAGAKGAEVLAEKIKGVAVSVSASQDLGAVDARSREGIAALLSNLGQTANDRLQQEQLKELRKISGKQEPVIVFDMAGI